MNAPTATRPARWEDFRSTVLPLFRRANAEEIEVRARLLLIRDLAIGAMSYSSEEAYHLLKAISEMAGRFALADIDLPSLREMRRILILTSANANAMQVLLNDIHHAEEARDARG